MAGTNLPYLLIFLYVVYSLSKSLQNVSDDELLQLIKDREKLIVLFTKPHCEPCNKYHRVLEILRPDFKKHLNADTVIAEDSHMARLYSPTKEPALVFFRHGIPLLFNGEPTEEDIYGFLEQNQTPAVKELSDKIFEHMTQAATGATTGDWFVMFYGASCVECQRLHAVWEGVGATLRGRVNVARIDANFAGASTAKRFHVAELPAFLFFRLGKVYKYELPTNDIKSFVGFATNSYKHAKGDPVPLLASPFDELVDWCVEMIKYWVAFGLEIVEQHLYIIMFGAAGFALVAITALIALVKANKNRPAKPVKKEKSK